MTLHRQATKIASKGRKGDSVLVHMTPKEVAGLQSLALSVNGKPLTVNPKTGLVEANSLKKYIGPLVGAIAGGMGWSTTTASVLGGIANGLANGMTLRNVGLGALSAGTARDMANDLSNPKVTVPITSPQGTTPLAPAPSNVPNIKGLTTQVDGVDPGKVVNLGNSGGPGVAEFTTPTTAQTSAAAQKQVAQTPTATPTATPTTPPTVLDRFKTLGTNAIKTFNDPKASKEFVDNHKLQALAMMAAAAATTQRAPKNGGEAPVQRWDTQWEPGIVNPNYGKYAGEPYYLPNTRGFKNGHWTTTPYGTVEPTDTTSYVANPQAYRLLHPIAAARGGYFATGGDVHTEQPVKDAPATASPPRAQDPRLFPFSGNVYDPDTGSPPDPRLTYSSPFTGATYQSAYASDLNSYLNNLNTSLHPRPTSTTPTEPTVRPTPGDNGGVNGGTPGTGTGGPSGPGGGGGGGGREPTGPGGGGGYGGGVGIGSLPVLPPPVTPNPPAPPTGPNGGTTPDAGGGGGGPLTDEQRQNMIDNATAGVPSARADAAEPASGRGGGGGGFGGGAGGSGPVGGGGRANPNISHVDMGNILSTAQNYMSMGMDAQNAVNNAFGRVLGATFNLIPGIGGYLANAVQALVNPSSAANLNTVMNPGTYNPQNNSVVNTIGNAALYNNNPVSNWAFNNLWVPYGLATAPDRYTDAPAPPTPEEKNAEDRQLVAENRADRAEQSGIGNRGSAIANRASLFQTPGAGGIRLRRGITGVEDAAHGGMIGRYAGGGGIGSLGSYSDGGRFLKGPGDGVSDDIPGVIHHPDGNQQPARLATGEFVFPARIVSEIGNGSSDAGAQKLYAIMDKIQNDRKRTIKNVAADTDAERHFNSMMA